MEKNEINMGKKSSPATVGDPTIKKIAAMLGVASLSVIVGAAGGCKKPDAKAKCTVEIGQCMRTGDLVEKDGSYFCDTKPYINLQPGCGKDKNEFLKAEVGQNCTVGTGACMRPGVITTAEDGKFSCKGVPGGPSQEICNGVDDDCDGEADEGITCACMQSFEDCDGRDNDCDGIVDEGYNVGTTCSVGKGDCARTGIILCDTEGQAYCSAKAAEPKNGNCEK